MPRIGITASFILEDLALPTNCEAPGKTIDKLGRGAVTNDCLDIITVVRESPVGSYFDVLPQSP